MAHCPPQSESASPEQPSASDLDIATYSGPVDQPGWSAASSIAPTAEGVNVPPAFLLAMSDDRYFDDWPVLVFEDPS